MASLSVIIPVYNSLSTLQRCVESVLAQRVGDMEIILVDDGSVDGSAALCDTLASEHHQVRTVHRVNGGLSAARNTGIERATGTWLSFVDSDDELAPGTLEPNLQIALSPSDTDLVEFPITVHQGSPSACPHPHQRRAGVHTLGGKPGIQPLLCMQQTVPRHAL